jgi:hypothetical protein
MTKKRIVPCAFFLILCLQVFSTSTEAQRKGLIFECGFEGDRCGANAEIEGGSISNVSSPARVGKGALKISCSDVRAELKGNGAGGPNKPEWKERWFAVSVYIPNDFKGNPKGSAMFLQIHERPDDCENWRSPPLNFSMRGDEMWITVKWEPKACSPPSAPEKQIWKDSASKYKGRWSDWVLHTIWSYKEDGLTEAWVDGKKVVTYRGPNAYNDSKEYYWKSGMYKRWSGNVTHYMDELRIGNEKATYEDMAPGGAPTTPPTASNEYTLQLAAGWNLVSTPVDPADSSISKLFSPIAQNLEAVYAFSNGAYKTYVPGADSNDLTDFRAGTGYWVYVNSATSLKITGSVSDQSVPLVEGWNLAGFNSLTGKSVTEAFASISGKYVAVYGFNTGSGTYSSFVPGEQSDLTTLEPGRGYWIYATEGVNWSK